MTVRVRVPATAANLGPGFDCLGMALSLYNEIEVEEAAAGCAVAVEGEGAGELAEAGRNLVLSALERVWAAAGRRPPGLRLRLRNAVPLARGLGSSAAAIAGGLVAGNALLGHPLGRQQLLDLALALEGHPDNVTPALCGGVTVACTVPAGDGGGGTVAYVRLDPPPDLALAVVVPDRPLATAAARAVLPQRVERADAVFNLQRSCLLTAALGQGRLDLLPAALEDRLHQPYRAALLPGLEEALARARREPALLGACLSGSGSSLLVFLRPGEEAGWEAAVGRVADAFREQGIGCRVLPVKPSPHGALVE